MGVPDLESTVDVEMGSARPSSDPLALERARARVEQAMFGEAEPARVARYELLEPIAGGGMGFVYAAYDPELDRKVAIKMLHPARGSDAQAHGRLLKEARALALLDHPNVVKVHDVLTIHAAGTDGPRGIVDAQAFIVMELVAGETLQRWEAAAPRRWRELVAIYAQAGEGLAAAHALDIVHRDFKPSNTVIGRDGRVRVLDFGLARFGADPTVGERAGRARLAPLHTAPGAIMGTLGYAAPEQLAGNEVTARSDQFSFCLALHQAIEGVPAFRGATLDARLASLRADAPALASDGRVVPGWLRAALYRGMAVDPARRHASMRALLAELTRARGWQRWRRVAVVAVAVAASAGATHAWLGESSLAPCDGGADEIAAVWGEPQQLRVRGALAQIDGAYAREVSEHVQAGLAARVRAWREVHRGACRAHRRGVESDAVLDHKMTCLRRNLDELAATVDVLGRVTPAYLSRAIDVVARAPAVELCADAAQLAAEPALPLDAAQRAKIAAGRRLIAQAAALDRAGRGGEALAALREAQRDASAMRYPPLVVETDLAFGRVAIAQGHPVDAAPALRQAMELGLANNLPRLAVEAAARRIYAEGVQSHDAAQLQRALDYVEPMSRALVGDRFVRPLLLNNIGVAYLAAQRPDDALRYFELAHGALAAEPDLELTIIDRNIAMLTPDAARREALAHGVWQRLRDALGEHHVATLDARVAYALYTADPAAAYERIASACVDTHRLHPDLLERYVDCESVRAALANASGRNDDALAAYAAVREATASAASAKLVALRQLATGERALLQGALAQATAAFQAVLEQRGGDPAWWVRKDALQAQLGLGRAAMLRGDRATAAQQLDAAARGFADIVRLNQSGLYRLRLAQAQRWRAQLSAISPERASGSPH